MTKNREDTGPKQPGRFGFFGFTPQCLQIFNNPWCFLFAVTMMMFGQGLSIIGLLALFMPQIERRYNFSSLDIGLIAAANDFAALVLGVAVSHYGNFGNKVRWIAIGGIITGIGMIIFTIPQYIIDPYIPAKLDFNGFLCAFPIPPSNLTTTMAPPLANGTTATTVPESCNESSIAGWYYLALFLIGQFVSGVGSIPIFSFVPAVFHECAKEKHMGIFLSIWQAGFFLGPMVAFGVSGPLLELWVDIDKPEGFEKINTKDPRFIGNWWLGFVAAAIIMFFSSMFALCFPADIKSHRDIDQSKEPTEHLTAKQKLAQFPGQMKRLMTNWTFIFNTLAINCTLMYLEGLAPFIAKLLWLRYGVPVEKLGIYLVASAAPSFALGILFGGLVTRLFKLEDSGKKSALLCLILQILCICGPAGFIMPGCDEMNLAGWQLPYTDSPPSSISNGIFVNSTCNAACGCHLGIAAPVCGSDGISYLGPCHAGCLLPSPDQKTFLNCSCVGAPNTTTGGTATIGHCDQDCKNWLQFLVLMAVVSLVFFTQLGPTKYVLVRCILPDDLAFAFGFQYFSTKILAHIPGPIIFGYVVDLNCVLWQKVCGETGYCWVYNVEDTVRMIILITGILVGIGVVGFLLSWVLYKEATPPEPNTKATYSNPALDQYDDAKL